MWGIARGVSGLSFVLPFQKGVGTVIIAAGLALDLISIGAFFRRKTTISPLAPDKTSALVTGGLYALSRNPMYLGIAVILVGFAIRLGNPVSALVIPIFIWYNTKFQIKPEEEVLSEKFGAEYDAYRKKVRRWI